MSVRHRRRSARRRVQLAPMATEVVLVLVEPLQERTEDGMYVCGDCRHTFRWLVDDGPLCMRCDALQYPYDAFTWAS